MTVSDDAERLRSDHFFLAAQRWLHRQEVASVTLVCQHGSRAPLGTRKRPAVETPCCLQELPLHRLLDLWLAGVREVLAAPNSCCDEQQITLLAERWDALVGEQLTISTGRPTASRDTAWSLAANRVPVDRRGLLGLSRRTPLPWPTHDDDADDHERLLTTLRFAGVESLQRPVKAVALAAAGCTACGVCVLACPHDALTLNIDDTQASLLQAPDLCQGDQQCVSLCPVDALTVASPLSWEEVIEGRPRELATLEIATCQRCRARFPAGSGSRWCEACRIRRSDPFGSHLPAAALELLRARREQ